MSAAGFLEKLLGGAEVAWEPLGEIASVQRGASPRPISKFITSDENGVPWIKIGDTALKSKYVTKTAEKITPDGAKKSRLLSKGDFIISNSMSFGRPYILGIDGAIHDGWASVSEFKSKLNSDFLYHYLSSHSVQNYWLTKINSGSVSNLNSKLIQSLLIPIPCPDDPQKSLAIQEEIVRILDSFTELTAELTAELTQRKKQYNHYREQLLTFDEDEVEWKNLGDVAEFRRGTAITKTQTKKGKIPVVANGPISTYSHDQHNRDGETVVVARSGAYAGYVSYWNQPIFLTDAFSVHPAPNLLLPKFVFYLLQNKQRQLHDMKKGAGVPHVRVKEVEQYGIPIPSLTEQARIVAILDKFDTLTTSLSEGLPREIELREKQYAYYRDQLLSFPKPDAEAA